MSASLATIASLAPFFGISGTLIGIDDLSEACVLTALGLLVAVPSLWFYKYLTTRVERFDHEMERASLEVLNLLVHRPMYAARAPVPVPQPPVFRGHTGDELRDIRRPWYRSSVAVGGMLFISWCVYTGRYSADEFAESAVKWATMYAAFTFAISWFAVYPVWIKVLRRTPGGLAALASLACLCWSLTELWWGAHLW